MAISLTWQDRDYLTRAVATEVDHRLAKTNPDQYRSQVAGVVDTILNRVASPQYPDTVKEVVEEENQFSAINGPTGRGYKVWKTVDAVPDSAIPPELSSVVNSWVNSRIGGARSSVGGHLNYANIGFSEGQSWLGDLDGPAFGAGQSVHNHGTARGGIPVEAVLEGDMYSPDGVRLPPGELPSVMTIIDIKNPTPKVAPVPANASLGIGLKRIGAAATEVLNQPRPVTQSPDLAARRSGQGAAAPAQPERAARLLPTIGPNGTIKHDDAGAMPNSQQIVEFARGKPAQSYAGQDGARPQASAAPEVGQPPNPIRSIAAMEETQRAPAPGQSIIERSPALPRQAPGQSQIERSPPTSVNEVRSVVQMEQTQRQPMAADLAALDRNQVTPTLKKNGNGITDPAQTVLYGDQPAYEQIGKLPAAAAAGTPKQFAAPRSVVRSPQTREDTGQSRPVDRNPVNDTRSIAQMEETQRQPAPGQSQIERSPAPGRTIPGQSQIERTPTTSVNTVRSVADMETTQRKPAPGQSVIERGPTPVAAPKPTPAPALGLTPSQAQPRAPTPPAAKAASAADVPKYITTSKRVPATPTAANGKVPLGEMTYSTSRDNKSKAAEGEAVAKKIEWKTVTTSKLNPEWVAAQPKAAPVATQPAKPAVTAKPSAPKKEERTPGNLLGRVRTAVGMPEDGIGGQILGNVRETFGMPRDGIGGKVLGNVREGLGIPRDGFGLSPLNLAGGVVRGVQRAAGLEQGPRMPVGTDMGPASNGGRAIQGSNGVKNSITQESHAWQVSTGQKARGNTASNDTQYENW